jgi:2-polyprenyl-6-methoxyphenol hydroxylase-like FAD-dependent oxidoreductase
MWIDPAIKEQGQEHWTFKASNEERLRYAKDLVHKAGVHPDLRYIIDIQPVEGLVPPFLFRDRIPVELPAGPVTIIGDAAHAMSPREYLKLQLLQKHIF